MPAAPIVVLAGINVGCFELFAKEGIRHIADLKGKTIGLRVTPVGVLTLMAAEVGLDPAKDIRWVTGADRAADPLELFVQGKIDAFLGVSAGASGTARPACRPRHPQHDNRPSMVAVFLLHAGEQPGLRTQVPGRDQARAARGAQGGRSLRQ